MYGYCTGSGSSFSCDGSSINCKHYYSKLKPILAIRQLDASHVIPESKIMRELTFL